MIKMMRRMKKKEGLKIENMRMTLLMPP